MEAYQCQTCGAVGTDWEEITEDDISRAVDEGLFDHPDDIQDALAQLGMQCGESGSMCTSAL